MSWIKELLSKWSCHHDWELEKQVKYLDCIVLFYRCKKCGKFKKKTL